MAYSDFPGDPVHRFFQIWQQVGDCNKKDLFVWVAETAGVGNHNDGFGATPDDTFQGGLAMGSFNMNSGDAPFFKKMADFYAISDNYHQPIMGGTGANFLALTTGDTAFYNGYFDTPSMPNKPTVPPTSFIYQGTRPVRWRTPIRNRPAPIPIGTPRTAIAAVPMSIARIRRSRVSRQS